MVTLSEAPKPSPTHNRATTMKAETVKSSTTRPTPTSRAWLVAQLSAGPLPVSQVRALAAERGTPWRALKKLSRELRLRKWRTGRLWTWALPSPQGRKDWRNLAGRGFQAPSMVRCARCAHVEAIEDRRTHGFCPRAELAVNFLWATRRCAAFEPSE